MKQIYQQTFMAISTDAKSLKQIESFITRKFDCVEVEKEGNKIEYVLYTSNAYSNDPYPWSEMRELAGLVHKEDTFMLCGPMADGYYRVYDQGYWM